MVEGGRPPGECYAMTQCLATPRRIYSPSTPSTNEDRRPGDEAGGNAEELIRALGSCLDVHLEDAI
jgi:hypothetical protein